MRRIIRWALRNRGLGLKVWLFALLIVMSPVVTTAQSSAKDSTASTNEDRSAAVEAWRVEMDYVRTNRPSHVNGFLTGSGSGQMGTIAPKNAFPNTDVASFSCTLVHPIDAGGDGWSAFVEANHAWSMSDVMLDGLAYPILGMVKTSSGKVFTIVPAVFRAKIDIEAGGVQQLGSYTIESKRAIKAGDSVSVLMVGSNILSVEAVDSAGQAGQSGPFLTVIMGTTQ